MFGSVDLLLTYRVPNYLMGNQCEPQSRRQKAAEIAAYEDALGITCNDDAQLLRVEREIFWAFGIRVVLL